jgi:hypothetical protein
MGTRLEGTEFWADMEGLAKVCPNKGTDLLTSIKGSFLYSDPISFNHFSSSIEADYETIKGLGNLLRSSYEARSAIYKLGRETVMTFKKESDNGYNSLYVFCFASATDVELYVVRLKKEKCLANY